MRRRSSIWVLLCLVCLIGAFLIWRLSGLRQSNNSTTPTPAASIDSASATASAGAAQQSSGATPPTVKSASTAPPAMLAPSKVTTNSATGATLREQRLKYRLSNTAQTVGQLMHNDRAVLLENALIDSTQPLTFSIPDSLRSQGDPGSYIVQSRGPINNAFRAMLQEAGATIIAYIPNNAYLVRMSADATQRLADQTSPVIPFEPYYKLDTTLLKQVMENKPVSSSVNVLVFPDARVATLDALKQLGADVIQESPSPFGTHLVLQNATDVPAIARLPGIQRVEVYSERTPANDLSRQRVGVTTDTITITNYLGLTGQGVLVDMNDSGVDATHPDLVNRVFGFPLTDSNGHGTHVAGIIAGDGTESITVTNAAGSINPGTNGQYRGKAPAANLFALPIFSGFSDFQLQQIGAQQGARISNNSWTYANPDYDINAASFDAAVRDALPSTTGSQPVLFVFAAGDIGHGDDNGLGGLPESIQSPATAKNVLTIGAIEQQRNITNVVSLVQNGATNNSQPWLGLTDSSNQVAAFSSRGNVGVAVEGAFGRFKPDLVAPGTFVVSTRSQQWDERAYYNPTNYSGQFFPNETVATNTIDNVPILPPISVPDNAVQIIITAQTVSGVILNLPIYVKENDVPTTADFVGFNQVSIPPDLTPLATGGQYFFRVGNPTTQTVTFNVTVLVVTTNDNGNYFEVLSNLNNSIGEPDWYRYETGTSMSAPAVSGVLALMQEFFQQKSITNSPALMKALLINGARPVNSIYNLQVQNNINYQGWGLVNLTNSIPAAFSNQTAIVNPPVNTPMPMLMFDQSPTNALATGDHRTYRITVDPTAVSQPLRVTLVWTDPPGNPSAATKLVNNLDLVVTNLDDPSNPLVYFGNDIKANANFNVAWDTNSAPNLDTVNNVENVYISPAIGTNYSITVIGSAVNVNAVTDQTNNMVQDYALVISSGNAQVGTALTLLADLGIVTSDAINLTVMTNQFSSTSPDIFGQVLGHQRVGANSPLIGTNTVPYQTGGALITIGETNQWHFYLITNSTPFTNAVFATSLPLDLAPTRMGVTNTADPSQATRPQADIDLYVSKDVGLLSLDPIAVLLADKSLGRGGYEQIILTNAVPGQVYYIGIKSEDHQAADYTFTSLFSLLAFNNGNNTFPGYPTPANIPDGTPALPGSVAVTSYAAAEGNTKVRSVTITNLIFHENFGDLVGTLTHDGQKPVVLNNHSPNNNYPFDDVYQDNGGVPVAGTQRPQGPGSLTDYIGDDVTGQWSLVEVDNSGSFTGRVDQLTVHIEPHVQDDLPPGSTQGIVLRNCVVVQPGSFEYDFVTVPFNGISVDICPSNAAPVVLYVRNGAVPTLTTYDYIFTNNPVTGCLDVSLSDLPPLQPGNLFFGIYNPNPVAHLVCYTAELTIGPTAVPPVLFSSTSTKAIFDDAVNFSSIVITNNRTIASAAVGVVLNHPRVSDLVLTLISPLGERFLLYENRGVNETNLGHLNITTNFFGTQTAGAAQANTNVLGPVPNTGTLLINYQFFTVPDSLDVYYDGVDIFSTGLISGAGQFVIPYGPGIGNTITIVMNQGGNPNSTTAWFYTPEVVALDYTYLTFTEDPDQASTAIKFARPPFDLANSGTNFPLSDFELATNGTYLGPTNVYDAFGGWNLFSNRFEGTNLVIWTNNMVSVVTDTNTAQLGSNYLALGLGTIVHTNIPTTPGRKYTFGYWYRGPGISGWWRGEGNALDSADPEMLGNNGSLVGSFTFPEGEVGQAFLFGGTNGFDAQQQLPGQSYVQVPQSPSLNVGGGSGLTVEGWINPTNIFIRQPLVEWLAPIPTNWVPVVAGETNSITTDTNLVPVGGPFLNPTTGHYYYLLPSTNWTRSEQWANALGGHLATVEDANEENWIYDLFSQYGGTNRTLWIGLTNNTFGNFGWAGGQTNFFYTNWANAQPSNCLPNQNYVAILNPTNVQASLWTLADNNGRTCGFPPTNRIHGVVEVEEIQTNGVQFWVSVTNSVITGTGGLYADLVDTNNVSHIIYSAPGLLQTNGMQHVALTYDRVSGIAALYYSGTNVATTNLGVFVPKTGGDVLIGKDMSRQTNTIFVGRMDEVSIYNRFLSAAEIAAIYNISVSSSNRNVGKFDPTITPALGLAEAQVSIGDVTNTILGANTKWQISTYSFTATTNFMPMQVTGIEPGMLMDSFTVSEAPLGNLYYLPETFLSDLVNQSVRGTWTLEIRDSRAGPSDTNTVGQLISWQMQFIYQNNAPAAVPLSPFDPSTNVVPAGKTAYFTVDVPLWATSATNILVSSTSPVDLLFNQTNPPTGTGVGDLTLLAASTGGVGVPVLVTNGVPPLFPGLRYYLGVKNSGASAATVVVQVDYNITTLSNSVPVAGHFATNEFVRYFAYDVSSNAVVATFQLLKLSNNVDLVVRRGVPLPTLTSSDYGSFNTANADENIYVPTTNAFFTNTLGIPLAPGRWYLGVFKRDPVAGFSILAKELDPPLPTIIELTNNVPVTFTTGPGAALTNFFHFEVADNTTNDTVGSIHFELYNMSGNGDLTVQTNFGFLAPGGVPQPPPFWQSSQQPGLNPELIFIQTNSVFTNLTDLEWFLGVQNHETNLITYTILAVIDTNGYFPAFPGAEGAGGGAAGGGRVGQNGDVYHVSNLDDSGPGSLRYGVNSATTNRTIVFDVSGTITLLSPLKINQPYLTIAGQTAPGDGVTVRGWVTSVQNTHDVVVRYMRFRPGDTNCPINQDDAFHFVNSSNVIADHISASWSIDEVVSATLSTNVTVQWSVIADSLNDSCHISDINTNTTQKHGYGSLLRYGYGTLSFHHNLYADNYSRNPRLGDNISLDFVNNVIYNWGIFPGYSADDSADNPLGFTNYLNYVNNYLITGTNFIGDSNVVAYIAFSGGSTNTWIFQTNNVMDANTNGILDGARTGWGMFTNDYTGFGRPFPMPPVSTDEGFIAYEKVLDFAGTAMNKRDSVDQLIVGNVRTQSGNIIDSQTQDGGWPALTTGPLPLDSDQDGIPDYWEITLGENPTNASNNLDRNGDGYTDLEEYINWLGVPHALTVTNMPVGVDLFQMFGNTGNLSFAVTNAIQGFVYLTNILDAVTNVAGSVTNVIGPVTNTGPYSNSFAIFTPTNNLPFTTNYSGYASFDVYVTNNDTIAYFGPVKVSVMVSAVPISYASPNTNAPPVLSTNLPNLTNNEQTTIIVTNTATDANTNLTLSYTVTLTIDTNAMIANGWPLNYVTTIPSPTIDTNGVITWTPSEAQGPGVYIITTVVSDNSVPPLQAANSFSVTVNETNTPPFWPPGVPSQTNYVIAPTATLVVTNTATDSDIPPNPLTYALTVAPPVANAVISTNGIITWAPPPAPAPGLYIFTTVVTDTNQFAVNAKSLSATNVFTVFVTNVAAPFVFTQPAQAVTGSSAQLNGMVTPNGLPTAAWYQWGTNTSYGNVTPTVNLGGSFNVIYTPSTIIGLVTNTVYHFRLVASNAVGITFGFDQVLDEANVVVWGANYVGQANVPAGLSNVVAIAGAYDHSLALKQNGTAVGWGDNTFGQATVPAGLNNLLAVAGGEYFSMALKNGGTVTAWGASILGQTNVPSGLNGVVMIAGGTFSSLALKNIGTITAWGANFFNLTNVPAGASNIVSIAGGGFHNLAIKNDGTVVAWGDNSAGQLAVPPSVTNVVAIAGGNYHSLALRYNGTVVAWGDNSAGQLNVPGGLSNVVAIAAGGFHSLALKNDGTVVTWGDNSAGQSSVPIGLSNVVAVASGYFHSMALTSLFFGNSTNPVILDLTNGVPQTNSILAGGIIYYRVHVPTNADFATNSLLFALNGPLNVWYSTNTPPSITNVNDVLLLPGITNGISVLSTNSVPAYIVPGSIYYLGVQNTNGFSVNYGIEVDFHLTLPIITLTNAIPYANSNSATGIATDYYRFVVSSNSARAQFEVDNPSGDVTLVVRRGLPLPSLGSYDYISANSYTNMELIVVLTNSTPVSLTPGDWYLSVVNVSGGPVTYSVKATEWPVTGLPVNITDISFSPTNVCITWDSLIGAYYYVQGVTGLTSTNWTTISPTILATNISTTYCVPLPSPYSFFRVLDGIDVSQSFSPSIVTLTNLITYSVTNSAGTNGLDYYRYNVSANASSVRFEVLNPNGNVTLLARYGQPLPSLGLYDYISANGGTSNELILVLSNSVPVPLTPGGWYLAVSNASGAPVNYTILTTELTNTPPTIITLTNMIGYANGNSGAGQATDSYRFVVSSNSARAQFEVDNPSGDVTLVVRRGLPLPSLGSYDYISANSYTNTELIVVLTNSSPVALAPGDWYLSVVNVSGGPVTYSVKATEWPVTGLPVDITDISFSPTNVCITWDSLIGAYYYVQGLTTLGSTNWTTISPTILATNTSTTYCVPLPSPYSFFRVQEGLVLSTNLPLLPPIIDLTNGVPYLTANAGGTNTVSYYRYVVTTNAARAQFEVDNPSGDVTLVVRRGLPLPSLGSYDYISANSYTNTELIVVLTNSSPVALAPGDWYLSVVNVSGGPVTYSVKATEWPVTGLPVDITDISFSPTNVCITWDSLIGAYYYVQGLTTLGSTNWTTISPTILATNTSTTYCVPLPSPYSFFRVQEGLVLSTNLPLLPPIIDLTNGVPYLTANAGGTNTVSYYRYVVTTNAARAQFEVDNPSGDVTLVVRRGLPLPSLGSYDYISANSYTNTELIVVLTNSSPVALAPGDWYLSVVNVSGGPVTYSVKATEWPVTGLPVDITDISFSPTNVCITWDSLIGAYYYVQGLTTLGSTNWTTISPTILATNTSTTYCVPLPSPYSFFRVQEGLVLSTNLPLLPPIIDLTNGVPYLTANAGGTNTVSYYRYVVTTNAARAQFEVDNPSGDVTLVVRRGLPLPSLGSYDYISANSYTNTELIVVLTNSSPVALAPGDWYLSVVNVSGGPVTYSVKATEWPVTGLPVDITDISFSPTNVCITWDSLIGAYYYVQGLTTLGSTNWTTISPTILATNTSTTYCVPLPSPYSFFRVQEGLVLSTNTATSPIVITLTNASPYLNSNLGGVNPVDYYRFVVSTNSARAQFEVNNPSGNVTLMARNGLPLPTLANFNYISQNPSTNDELIVVFTNSSPVVLTPGDWYLAVSNASGGVVTYSAKATQWPVTGVPIGISNISFSSSSICLTWNSLAGVHYYVQGLTSLGSTNWTLASPPILATNIATTFCVTLPSPYSYFRVEEGLVPVTPAIVPPPVISATFTNSGFLLRWNGPVSAQYKVQWASNLPPSWNLFTNIITSGIGQFSFFDDGSQTAGLGVTRFYRVVVFP